RDPCDRPTDVSIVDGADRNVVAPTVGVGVEERLFVLVVGGVAQTRQVGRTLVVFVHELLVRRLAFAMHLRPAPKERRLALVGHGTQSAANTGRAGRPSTRGTTSVTSASAPRATAS